MEKPQSCFELAKDYSSNGHWLECSGSWEVDVVPVSQVSQALKLIENVQKISTTVFKSGDLSEWNKEQLLEEVGALVELRHPNIIRLVRSGQDSEQSFSFIEEMVAHLRNFMKKKLEPAPRPKPRPFNLSDGLDILTQLAKGMYYLHTQQIVHRDLKSTNVLMKGGYLEGKLADFGIAKKLSGGWDRAAFEIACSTRRPRWTAPEVFMPFGGTRPYSESLLKSDVYCYGILSYEFLTGKYPFDGINDDALLEQIEAGVRPELPGELDDDLKGLITSCWDPDPNKRPIFQSICHFLDDIRSTPPAVSINKSSGKDLVLRLFKRIPQLHGPIVGPLGQVRKNANPPAIESSTWDDQKKAHELQLSICTVSFGEHLRIKPSDLKILRHIGSGSSTKVYEATWLDCTFAVKRFKSQGTQSFGSGASTRVYEAAWLDRKVEPTKLSITSKTAFGRANKHIAVKEPVTSEGTQSLLRVLVQVLALKASSGALESERNKTRTRNWSAEETRTMLELTEEALSVDDVPIWDYVSENLWENCGFDRASKSCENMWDALLHSYKATQDDESKIRACTYLDLECREIIERILASKSFEEKTRSIQTDADFPSCQNDVPFCQFQSSGSEGEVLHDDSWTTGRLEDSMGLFGFGDEALRDDLLDEDTCSSEYQGLSGDITGTIESYAEATMDSLVSRITETHYETNASYAGRKRSAATVMEDEFITRMAPYVNKQIEDALKPLVSVLRGREEDKQKYRQKLLDLEEEKLSLRRRKMLFTPRDDF